MTAQASGRFSPALTGWVAVLLMAGWIGFLIVPFGRKEEPRTTRVVEPRPGETDLAVVGLTYNVDWIGLPEYFAVWAKDLVWLNDKTYFAYWNQGTETYSYFFEATRGPEGVRFRPIAMSLELDATAGGALAFNPDEFERYRESRRPESPTHPFVFPRPLGEHDHPRTTAPASPRLDHGAEPKVEIEIPVTKPVAPAAPPLTADAVGEPGK
jgi:hypothetical protein